MHCCPKMANSVKMGSSPIAFSAATREYYLYLFDYSEFFGNFLLPGRLCPAQLLLTCPFCGEKLPHGLREEWYLELQKHGHQDSAFEDLPENLKTDKWWRERDDLPICSSGDWAAQKGIPYILDGVRLRYIDHETDSLYKGQIPGKILSIE